MLKFLFSGIMGIRHENLGEGNMNYITIDKEKCKACYLCINECPKKLLKVSKETNNLGDHIVEFDDPDHQCLACAMCAMRCPDMAITGVFKG